MAKKPRSPVADYAVYLAVRSLVALLQAIPVRIALGLGSWLGGLLYLIDKRHRQVARDNLRHAFPEHRDNPREIERIVRGCFDHFCTMVVEIAVFPRRIHMHNWRKYTEINDFGRLVRPLVGDRPMMLVTAHFGNWEVAGYVTGVAGQKTYAIARLLDNPRLNDFLLKFREKTGQTILNKTGDFERITAALAGGGVVSTLGDQDAGPKGLFVDFFGRPASSHKAVALLAMQHDAIMFVMGCPRTGWPLKFAWDLVDVIDPRDYTGNRVNAVREITERFTRGIESVARRYPEQYFWLHRRWKHQPPAKKIPAGASP